MKINLGFLYLGGDDQNGAAESLIGIKNWTEESKNTPVRTEPI